MPPKVRDLIAQLERKVLATVAAREATGIMLIRIVPKSLQFPERPEMMPSDTRSNRSRKLSMR